MTTRRRLSPILNRPPWRIAAIEETQIAARPIGAGAVFTAEKRPLAVLVAGPGGTIGTDARGYALNREEIERLLPGALDRLARAAARGETR